MHRILITAAVLAALPVCAQAQSTPTTKDASETAKQTAPRRSHTPYGEAIQELTRAAREQAATARPAPAVPAAPGARDATHKTAPVAPVPVPAVAPALADSNRS